MTTKKIVIIVVSIFIVLALIVVLFVGGILGMVFYGISNSDAAHVAKDFLSSNERLKQDIGEVKGFTATDLIQNCLSILEVPVTGKFSVPVIHEIIFKDDLVARNKIIIGIDL